MPMDKVHIIFGGLDMQPRVNMALILAREAKWPQPLLKRIEAVRHALQRDGEKLAERRNQVVHGVHSDSEIPAHFKLTMVRWKGPKTTQDVSITDVRALALRLGEMAQEVWSIFDDYGVWKFGPRSDEDSGQPLLKRKPGVWLKVQQHLKSAIKRLLRH